jgi:hypothetical protein
MTLNTGDFPHTPLEPDSSEPLYVQLGGRLAAEISMGRWFQASSYPPKPS